MFVYPLGDGAGLGPLEPWQAEEFAEVVARARDHLAPWIPFAHTVVDAPSPGLQPLSTLSPSFAAPAGAG